ncbi:MAG: nuclear transport factor 2 family protein [Candidatus Eiseniibacteriota bacterium]
MTDHAATVHRYDEVWNTRDAASRLAILSEIWAEDGVYVDPEVPDGVHGRDALSDFVATSHDEMPELDIGATSPLVVLGERGWYRWQATTGSGETFDGIDFIEFADDGRIQRLTNFYDA